MANAQNKNVENPKRTKPTLRFATHLFIATSLDNYIDNDERDDRTENIF